VEQSKRVVQRIGAWTIGHRPALGSGVVLPRSDPSVWFIELDAWIIQDGNYRDFAVGEEREFAVEFSLRGELWHSDVGARSTRYVQDGTYAIDAELLAVADDRKWVLGLDGLAVYCNDAPPTDVNTGALVSGVIDLGIDPFFYFERGGRLSDLPALIYTWQILRVFAQTAPYVERRPKEYSRDLSAWNWRVIPATDAWNGDGGSASYLLECRLTAAAPKFFRGD
jgi:hypothetical protein